MMNLGDAKGSCCELSEGTNYHGMSGNTEKTAKYLSQNKPFSEPRFEPYTILNEARAPETRGGRPELLKLRNTSIKR